MSKKKQILTVEEKEALAGLDKAYKEWLRAHYTTDIETVFSYGYFAGQHDAFTIAQQIIKG